MNKVLIGLGIGALVAAIAAAVFVWNPAGEAGPQNTASSSPLLTEAMGRSRDISDVGEQHYKHGRYPEAIAYWEERAAKGDAYAAFRLGVEFMDGKPGVVQRDFAKAVRYHTQAAMAGIALSMFDLGSLNEFGNGVEKSLPEAARWYGHSARYGLAQGQYNFATMLETGAGVAQDDIEAYKYFILAARGGFTGVPYSSDKRLIDRNAPLPTQILERKLTREQLAEGRARADAFRPASGPLTP